MNAQAANSNELGGEVAVLIRALNTQAVRINELEARIDALEAKATVA